MTRYALKSQTIGGFMRWDVETTCRECGRSMTTIADGELAAVEFHGLRHGWKCPACHANQRSNCEDCEP